MNYFTSLHRTARARMLSSFLRFLFFSLSLSEAAAAEKELLLT
jgi:hypothetical protein